MAYRPSILLSKEAVEAIKKHYADSGKKTPSDAFYRGAGTYVTKTKEASDLIVASEDSRANAWNQLTVKAALSQGEEDVKISLGMLGSPEQYRRSSMQVTKAREAAKIAQESARTARANLASAKVEADPGHLQNWLAELSHFTPGESRTIPPFDESARKRRAVEIDQATAAAQTSREYADGPWDAFVTAVSQTAGRGSSVGPLFGTPYAAAKLAGRSFSF